MGAFLKLVKEWKIDELAPHAEHQLEAAKKRAPPLAKTKESSAPLQKQALLPKQTPLQKQAPLQKSGKPAPKARGNSGRKCFGCGSTEYDIVNLIDSYITNILPDI